jgi:hypothetical protein
MKELWDSSIERAEFLAVKSEFTSELLSFYSKLLRTQKRFYESLRSQRGWLPSGVLEDDLSTVRPLVADLLAHSRR